MAAAGRHGPGLAHLLVASTQEIVFFCFGLQCYRDEGWIRPGLPSLRMLAGSLQHFWADLRHFQGIRRLFCPLLRASETSSCSIHARTDKLVLCHA